MSQKLTVDQFKQLAGISIKGPTLGEDNRMGDGGGDPSHVKAKAINKAAEPHPEQAMNNPIDRPTPHANSSMPPDVSVHILKKLAGLTPEVSTGFLDNVRLLANESLESSKAFANRMNMVGRPDPRVEQHHIASIRASVEHVQSALKALFATCKAASSGHHEDAANLGAEYTPVPKPEMMQGADEREGGRKI